MTTHGRRVVNVKVDLLAVAGSSRFARAGLIVGVLIVLLWLVRQC